MSSKELVSHKTHFSKNYVTGQGHGHNDREIVCNTPPSQDASTHQIRDSYLKQYRRYAPDTKRDGQMDSVITICLPKFLLGHKKYTKNSD